jgi:hypothetical protein
MLVVLFLHFSSFFFFYYFLRATYSLSLDTIGNLTGLGVHADRARAKDETVGNNSLGCMKTRDNISYRKMSEY